nr:MAG TPA: hypothetical protein [Caudoviricetes sp.]
MRTEYRRFYHDQRANHLQRSLQQLRFRPASRSGEPVLYRRTGAGHRRRSGTCSR